MIASSGVAHPTATIDWLAFLARPRLPSPDPQHLDSLRGRSILVTGAGGSIGSALSLELARLAPRHLALLDASEQALYRLQRALADAALPHPPSLHLANVADPAHLGELFSIHRPELVFHAAAYKHVPLLEEHSLEAIANNALATQTLVQCAHEWGTERVVLLSTDKAVEPVSILGTTKRIAELIVLAHGGVALRLGNVLGTEGSVSQTFLRQIASGGPITVSDPRAERYFLTCDEAVDLLLGAAVEAPAGSLLVPSLDRPHTVTSMARFLIDNFARQDTLKLTFTGLRPGDKLRESLWSRDEETLPAEARGYRAVAHKPLHLSSITQDLSSLREAVTSRDLEQALAACIRLVPDYLPSPLVLTQIQSQIQTQANLANAEAQLP